MIIRLFEKKPAVTTPADASLDVSVPAKAVESDMSFLSKFGADVKAVFGFLGSAKGQAIVAGVEGVAEAVATAAGVGAPVQLGVNLINTWLGEIMKAQALATAAAATPGADTNLAKAGMVLSAMTPQVVAFAKQQGLAAPTATSLNAINTALVTALGALGADNPTTATATAATA